MLSGDKARVLAAARGEKDPALRDAAVKTLGIMGAQEELWQLYKSETSVPVRKGILHALFIGGAVDQLAEALRTERDPELRAAAIHSLGLAGGDKSGALLVATYKAETDPEIRKKVMHALFLQGNGAAAGPDRPRRDQPRAAQERRALALAHGLQGSQGVHAGNPEQVGDHANARSCPARCSWPDPRTRSRRTSSTRACRRIRRRPACRRCSARSPARPARPGSATRSR